MLKIVNARVLKFTLNFITFNTLFFVHILFESAAEDWPRFMGPRGDGTSLETGLLDSWPENGPPMVWKREIGTGYSAPSVRGNKLVLHHRVRDEEAIECFKADTGESVWKYSYPSQFRDPYGYNNGPRCTPILTDNRCYTFGAEGVLTCVDLETGQKIWQRNTHKDWNVPEAFFGVGSTPVLHNNLLLVMVGGQPNSGMVAFDATTGDTIWENVGQSNWQGVPLTGWRGNRKADWSDYWKLASYSTPRIANIHGQTRLLCLMRQGLVSVDPASGKTDFSFWFRAEPNESVNAMTPIVDDDHVFISSAYYNTGCVLLRVNDGGKDVEVVWRSDVLETHFDTPIYFEGHLFAFSGRQEYEAKFRCVEFKTGELKWQTDGLNYGERAGSRPGSRQEMVQRFGCGSCIRVDGKFVLLGERGMLALARVSPEKYDEISRFKVPDFEYPCWTAPILSRKRLYLRNGERLLCYDLGSEK